MKRFIRLYKNTIVKNFFLLGAGNLAMQLFNMITLILIAKFFLPPEYGIFSFMLSQALLIATLSDFGMRNIIIREVARSKNNQTYLYSTSVVTILFTTIIFSLLYLIYNHFWGEFTIFQLFIIFSYSFCFSLISLCENILMGTQKMLPIALIGVFFSLIWFFFVFLIKDNSITVNSLFIASIILLILKLIFYCSFLKIGLKYKLFHSLKKYKFFFLIKKSLPYLGLTIICLPANYLSLNFLQINSTSQELGFFTLAQKLTTPMTLAFSVIFSAIFPNFSLLWKENKAQFFHIQNKGIFLFIIGSSIFAFCLIVLITKFFHLFFDLSYFPAIIICKILIWYAFLMGLSSLAGTIWGAMDKEILALKMSIINSAINIPLLWIGSKYGGVGLASAYLVSFSIFTIILWIVLSKKNNIDPRLSFIWVFVVTLLGLSLLIK